jgi:16S rRNA (guanine966-N2)-methyltransferase
MFVRIIAGKYGSRKIEAPDNSRTHPMGERVRNAMFNSIGAEIDGKDVLDAFAGTGAIGLEALSRGARTITFVERDKIALKILTKNIVSLQAEDQSTVIRTSVSNWLETKGDQKYDIIFADPPYHDLQLSTVSQLFALLKPNGLMVLSHTGRGEVPNLENGIVVVDNRSYGNAHLTSFRRGIHLDAQ